MCGTNSAAETAVSDSIKWVREAGLFYVRDASRKVFQRSAGAGSAAANSSGTHVANSNTNSAPAWNSFTQQVRMTLSDDANGFGHLFAGPTGAARTLIGGDFGNSRPTVEVRLLGYRTKFGNSFNVDYV